MERLELGRREVLAAAAAGLTGLAGCSTPQTAPAGEVDRDPSGREPVGDRPLAEGSAYTDVYEATVDSVVMVRAFGLDDPFDGEGETRGQGSGFLFQGEYLVTNEHVVAGAEEVDVRFRDGTWSTVEVVGEDIYSDLAVMRAERLSGEASPLSLSPVRPVVGQEVLAIGNPLGFEGSMTKGIVSGVNRSLPSPTDFQIADTIQTDAPVEPGNSGGPLVDLDGDVLGVVNAGAGDGIGFAISAALTERVVPALIEDGHYDHSFLGVSLRGVDPVVAEANDLPQASGVILVEIIDDGPSEGLLQGSEEFEEVRGEEVPIGGDVIVAMDDREIVDQETLSQYLALETSPGQEIEIEVYRAGDYETVTVELGARPDPT